MLSNLKLIFIHGVNDQTTNYSQDLYAKILASCRLRLRTRGLSQSDIDDVLRRVVHHEVLWADLTTDVINRYQQLSGGMPFFWGNFTRKVDPLGVQIMQYIKDKGDKQTGPMNILADVDNDMRRILKADDVGEDTSANDGQNIIFVAHSLGSVIAFDYAFGFRRKHRLNPKHSVESFITLGSPLPLFTAAMGHPDSDMVLPPHIKKWVNIRSIRDGIARPMRPFFRNIPIEEYKVTTSLFPIGAHKAYWHDEQTAQIIAYEVLHALDEKA